MKNLLTKKNTLVISSIGAGISMLMVVLETPMAIKLCRPYYWCYERLFSLLGYFVPLVFLSVVLFLFSLITYRMRESVTRAWLAFVEWYIPLSLFLILLTPSDTGGGYGPSLSFGKPDVAFLLSGLFVLISIGVIFAARGKENNR